MLLQTLPSLLPSLGRTKGHSWTPQCESKATLLKRPPEREISIASICSPFRTFQKASTSSPQVQAPQELCRHLNPSEASPLTALNRAQRNRMEAATVDARRLCGYRTTGRPRGLRGGGGREPVPPRCDCNHRTSTTRPVFPALFRRVTRLALVADARTRAATGAPRPTTCPLLFLQLCNGLRANDDDDDDDEKRAED